MVTESKVQTDKCMLFDDEAGHTEQDYGHFFLARCLLMSICNVKIHVNNF